MRVLLCHNHYQQPGGEDRVFDAEIGLLEANGIEVRPFTLTNENLGARGSVSAFLNSVWSYSSYRAALDFIVDFRPDIVHVHNFFATLSPSIYWAARQGGAAVVQTLHNYRLLCPEANFQRHGSACELCLDHGSYLPAIRHGCYRDSRIATAAVAAVMATHWHCGTWESMVDRFIALSHFARRKFIQAGLPAHLIRVKPNFVEGDSVQREGDGDFYLYAGRLSREKGVDLLVEAWLASPLLPQLVVVGAGPLEDSLRQLAAASPRIRLTGPVEHSILMSQVRRAKAVVLPSRCYEGFPNVLMEAFSCGVPVIVPNHGVFVELVEDGVQGKLFTPGDRDSLVAAVLAFESAPALAQWMGNQCRQRYVDICSPAANLRETLAVYGDAIAHSGAYRA